MTLRISPRKHCASDPAAGRIKGCVITQQTRSETRGRCNCSRFKSCNALPHRRTRILEELGHELRRPEAQYLRDGIYELRTKHAGVNYRMLYFFHGRTAAVVSHGIMKQQAEVPPKDIDTAVRRKALFEAHPQRHTFIPPED